MPVPQLSNFLGPELPDIISSLVSPVCLTLFLKRWQPVRIFRFGDLGASQVDMTLARTRYSGGTSDPRPVAVPVPDRHRDPVERAAIQALFAPGGAMYDFVINISPYHSSTKWLPVCRRWLAPRRPTPRCKFDWLSATGTAILFAALLSIVWLRMKPKDALTTFARTLKDLALPIYSIGMVLAFAFISNYSGLSSTLAWRWPIPATRLPSSRRSLAGWGYS